MDRQSPTGRFLLVVLVPMLLCFGCGKGYKQIVIVKDWNAYSVVVMKGSGPPRDQPLWESGRVVAFRTTGPAMFPAPLRVPGGSAKDVQIGEAGKVYRLDKDLNLKEIGTFDLNLSDDQLLDRYGE